MEQRRTHHFTEGKVITGLLPNGEFGAYRPDEDEGRIRGYGHSRLAAIADLVEAIEKAGEDLSDDYRTPFTGEDAAQWQADRRRAIETSGVTMMDTQLKAKWVAALRSGEFRQTVGTLQDGLGANCCLGVLARIQGVSFNDWHEEDREASCLSSEYSGGLEFDVMLRLAKMNDGGLDDQKAHSFAEIADYIEKNL